MSCWHGIKIFILEVGSNPLYGPIGGGQVPHITRFLFFIFIALNTLRDWVVQVKP